MARKRKLKGPSGYTLLVVDDQDAALESGRLLLESEGHHVLTASGGEEALRLLDQHKVHVALVDYFMPRMNGEELVEKIKEREPAIQIVLQTGYSGERPPRAMLRRLDIHGYHDKAEGPEKLLIWVDVAIKAYVQLERIREAEQLKSDILNNLSHEFRSPLHVILGYSDMLAEGACGDLTADAGDVLQRLRSGASILLDLINDFLSMATLEGGASGVNLTRVSLDGLREDAERAAAGLRHRRPIALRWTTDGTLAVLADRPKLRVILFNLLASAVKLTSAGEVTLAAGTEGDAAWIAVRERSVGSEPENQEAMCESADDGSGVDTDLGLAIARRLARLMGGDLSIWGTPGAGATFTLRLPRADDARPADQAPVEEGRS